MNDIKMSINKNFFDASMAIEDVKSATKQEDVFTFNVKIDKEHLKGFSYGDLLDALFEHIKSRIVVAPNEKIHFEPGFYAIDLLLPIEEVIVDGDTMCVVTQGNPFTKSNGISKHMLPFYADICVEEECDYGPMEEE